LSRKRTGVDRDVVPVKLGVSREIQSDQKMDTIERYELYVCVAAIHCEVWFVRSM
jgi:hypothetical protein